MKITQVENTESAGVRVSEPKTGVKGDLTPEPTAKRTVRPSKSTKEPTVASSPAREHQLKPVVNGKPLISCGSASVSTTAREGKSQPQIKASQGVQKEKEVEKKTDGRTQVRRGITLSERFISKCFHSLFIQNDYKI